jgi:Uma2 family endonuclease
MEKRLDSISLAEFIAWEQSQEGKHELVQGRVVAFAGGSLDHDDITANVHFALRSRLRPPCRAYGSNAISETATRTGNNGFRADVVITCSEQDAGKALAVKHPRVIVEVRSPSNTGRVWEEKLFVYRDTRSVEQLVIVESETRAVTSYLRDPAGVWQPGTTVIGEGDVAFPSVGVTLGLAESYRGTSLDEVSAPG